MVQAIGLTAQGISGFRRNPANMIQDRCHVA
jgi:hypothetical protein